MNDAAPVIAGAPTSVRPISLEPAAVRTVREVFARLIVGALFVMLTRNLIADFMLTHHVTGLLLIASEGLVVVLTFARRSATFINRSVAASATTFVSMIGPPLLRASGVSLVPDVVSALALAAGLCLVIAGKLTLGRSFGLVPANRGIVASGPYLLVRHPIYTGYLVTHLAFLAAHPSIANTVIVVSADAALSVRALIEENTLASDERYQAYCRRVAWHFVPGLF